MALKALAINCTLKTNPNEASSSDAMIEVLKRAFAQRQLVVTETVRVAALNILPGVTSNEGEGDERPALREKILAHDILIFGGPIWMGQIGSIAKRVLERMDAFLDETDEAGRMKPWDPPISRTWKTHLKWSRRQRKWRLAALPTWRAC